MEILWFLLIGLIAGWLAGLIVRGGGYGVIGDIVIGIIGSLIGGKIFSVLGVQSVGTIGSIITAVIGAVILLTILRLIKRPAANA